MMEVYFLAKDLIKDAEGFSHTIYMCPAGKETIGYGRNLEVFPLSDKEKRQCVLNGLGEISVSQTVAEDWLGERVSEIYQDIHTEPYFKGGVNRQAVLIDLVYNLGKKKFLTFKKFLKAMEEEDFNKASEELIDSRWYRQVGNRGKRNAEIIKEGEDK